MGSDEKVDLNVHTETMAIRNWVAMARKCLIQRVEADVSEPKVLIDDPFNPWRLWSCLLDDLWPLWRRCAGGDR
ncbi:hypothetical protein WH7805_09007 [Synechococcus sp. WH 7805]|nr:hypothetical protein WH7805_09007 [Synechococcus sp. WH 7805]